VLERLEAHHDVDRAAGKRQVRAISHREGEIWRRIHAPRVLHRRRRYVDAEGTPRHRPEQRSSVSFAGGDVEDVLARTRLQGEEIAVPMEMLDLSPDGGGEAFAGVLQLARWSGKLQRHVRRALKST